MRRQRIELIDGGFRLGNKPFFIYSGEVHYFRIPRKDWEDRLRKAKRAGLNTVSFYIPWRWHEPREGFFDFTGRTKPQRDVVGFINLVEKVGLYFLGRPGPVNHGEIIMDGLPTWLFEKYPQIRIKKNDGKTFPYPSLPTFMHPVFQEHISRWYSHVMPILKKHQVNQGGSLIAVQLDNEIGMVNWLAKAADYSKIATRYYQEYLKEKYVDIDRLNKIYRSRYMAFEDIQQPANGVDKKEMMRYWDWSFFYQRYYALYYQRLAIRARDEGIEVPIIANIPQFYDYDTSGRGIQGLMTTLMFRDFSKLVPEVIFGGAYQMRRLNYENFHDIGIVTEMVKAITSPGIPSICAELQVGVMTDRPRIYSPDVELNLKASAGHGLSGLNGYLFCGGINPKGIGLRGTYHEWQAPISSEGIEKQHIKPIKLFGKFIKTFGQYLSVTKKQYEIVFGFYPPYYSTMYLDGEFIDDVTKKRDRFFFDGVARLMQMAGINYSLMDIQKVSHEGLSKIPCLWVFTLDFMDIATQKKLVQYVKEGGNLILNPKIPVRDLSLKRAALLQKELGFKVIKTSLDTMVVWNGLEHLVGEGEMLFFDPKGCRVVSRTSDGNACAVLKKLGRGKTLAVGFGIPHLFDYQTDVIRYYARIMGIEPMIHVDPFDVHCVLRANDEFGFLFISNYHDEFREVSVTLILPGENKVTRIPSIDTIVLPNRSSWILPLRIPLSDGIKIRYSTAEILGYNVRNKKLSLTFHGARDARVEIILETGRPKKAVLNKECIAFTYKDGLCRMGALTTGREETLSIEY